MIKGSKRSVNESVNTKYVGFTSVEVVAVNPTKSELNKLLGKEDSDEDKPIEYLSADQEGNERLRLSFWLYDKKLDNHFVYSFNLTNKERVSKDGNKAQYINSVCLTAWADDEANLQPWFKAFLDKEKNEIGDKKFRKAVLGEEELGILLRAWLGKLNWNDTDCEVTINLKSLFAEDYSELRALIGGDYSTPFVILLGVRTDEADSTKQYQQVYGKSFLPNGFIGYIEKGFKFPTDYSRKTWKKFEDEVSGEYGFSAYFDLVPLKEYDQSEDPALVEKEQSTPSNSKF